MLFLTKCGIIRAIKTKTVGTKKETETEMKDNVALMRRRRDEIFSVLRFYSTLLNLCPCFISAEDVSELTGDVAALSPSAQADARRAAVYGMLLAAGGLSPETNEAHRVLAKEYLLPSIFELHPSIYKNNDYFRLIPFHEAKEGRWTLTWKHYAPYELFVAAADKRTADFKEIPTVGYFTEAFSYPAVLEDGREWMTVTPNEIETMGEAVSAARGEVLTLGLGLGYFALMASQKEEVRRVTVVERDPAVIRLFKAHILPYFPHKEKVRVIKADALAYLDSCPSDGYDLAFADLWHDPSDGVPLYLALKKKEGRLAFPVLYWIESALLSHIRWRLFADWEKNGFPADDPTTLLDDGALAKRAAQETESLLRLFCSDIS